MAFWNYGDNNDAGVSQVSLFANGVTSLGTFSVSAFNSDPFAAVRPVVVTFAPTAASSIRVQIDSNLGDSAFTAFGEVAFEAGAVPEPSVLALMLGGLGGIRLYQRRKTPTA